MDGLCLLDVELCNFPRSSRNIGDKWEMVEKSIENLRWHHEDHIWDTV